MEEQAVQVDGAGLHFPAGHEGSGDVLFDGHHAWSYTVTPREAGGEVQVSWPVRMRQWLDGASAVVVREGETELFSGEVVFGSGEGRVAFLDKSGIPVMIDKWGLLQRPFSGRDASVVEQMVDITDQILDVMRTECGVEGWIAFGTLLGAAREGAVIGHDSDIDLAYLSDRETPAEMTRELFEVARALRRHGMKVVSKSGAFITVVFTSPDGGQSSIDVYTCFYVGADLYETATVRRAVPRSAILPLTELEFEGRMLPAPADPDTMLAVSYGPGWRVPDPSFKHDPGPEVTERFDGWFSSVMRQRRDWERFLAEESSDETPPPSDFVGWAGERLAPAAYVVDVGTGNGQDALTLATQGWRVLGLDYSRQSWRIAARTARRSDLPARFEQVNLYDLRDVLTRGALVSREASALKAVYCRELLETLDPDGLSAFWSLTAMVLSGGGSLYVESLALSRTDAIELHRVRGGGRVRPLDPRTVEDAVVAAGGRVVERENVVAGTAAVAGGARTRWRLHAQWPVVTDRSTPEEELE
ncbi:MAG: class I SAM-dependent methyltransferase [Nocardioides sp.]|nr:class I SAM-dependent methyltransferase [Nocardioides sp.]